MAHHELDSTTLSQVLGILNQNGLPGIGAALELLLNEAMKLERSEFLRAGPYEHSEERRGHANGFKPKTLKTRSGSLQLAVPQVRGLREGEELFYPSVLERGVRSERALKLAIAEMYVQGVSTRKVMAITEQLCGFEVSSTQVSRAAEALDAELEAWRNRPLGEMRYLFLDARYEKVRIDGAVRDAAVLIAIGVRPDGRRQVLGVSVSLSEAEVHWRGFLASLNQRGLRGVRLITSDDHAGLKAARQAELSGVPWQRCQFHLQQNIVAYVPTLPMRKEVPRVLRSIFNAPGPAEVEKLIKDAAATYAKRAPRLAEWIETNVPEGLTVFLLPSRTGDSCERATCSRF